MTANSPYSRAVSRPPTVLVAVTIVVLVVAGSVAAVDASTAPEPAAVSTGSGAPLDPEEAPRAASPKPPPANAKPRSVKLWPLFEYESDPAAHTSRVRVFGPLIEYRTTAERQSFAFRPFLSISQSYVGHDDDVSVLYPLMTSHWGQTEQVTKGLGGLVTYRTRTSEDGRTLESQRAQILPVYFYDWEPGETFGRFSVAPLYADLDHVFGYDRVAMVLFPAYLHLQQGTVDRRYYLFPLISRDGEPGSGYRLWPFPLRDRQGKILARELRDGDADDRS